MGIHSVRVLTSKIYQALPEYRKHRLGGHDTLLRSLNKFLTVHFPHFLADFSYTNIWHTTFSGISLQACTFWYAPLLTPRCRVLLEKLTSLQLVKKFPVFHGTRRFITALTSVRQLSLSWASRIQSIYTHPTSWRSILILSTHPCLGLPSCLLPYGFPTKTLYTPSPHPYAPHAQPISFFSILSPAPYWLANFPRLSKWVTAQPDTCTSSTVSDNTRMSSAQLLRHYRWCSSEHRTDCTWGLDSLPNDLTSQNMGWVLVTHCVHSCWVQAH